MAIETHGYPLAFKLRQGRERSPVILNKPGQDAFVVEAHGLEHHQKEAVVTEGETGSTWRVTSDEGVHLKGTNLAPFPLGFFNAGLQSDLAGRIAKLADARGIRLDRIGMRLVTSYSLSGSFIQGTGRGVAEEVRVSLDLGAAGGRSDVSALVSDAVQTSPAFALLAQPIENVFALYVNGQRRDPTSLPASTRPDLEDPYRKYASPPRPLSGAHVSESLIIKTDELQPGTPTLAPASGRVVREVLGRGELQPDGIYRSFAVLNMPGATTFAFASDETEADLAPSGLGLLSAGIVFCYMTQISRYIENMKLDISGVRLVQVSPYGVDKAGHGLCKPCDTHLFLNGRAEPEKFEMLQLVAANTCYLHQSMVAVPRLSVVIEGAAERQPASLEA